jgi:PAS domain S-box-containing protein
MHADRSDRAIYLGVLGPLVLAIVTLLVVSVGGFQVLSAARAYVGGESLWSKARSQAVARLRVYLTKGPAAVPCEPLTEWLEVPLGDRDARLAMERSPPDLDAARAGFLRGGNHPDDLDGLIQLYLKFGWMPLLRDPIDDWRRGDVLIEKLRALGEQLCAQPPGDATPEQILANLAQLDAIDRELIEAEKHFSASLGVASRLTATLLTGASLLLALLLAAGSVWFVMRSLRSQIAQRRALLAANARWDLVAGVAGVGVFTLQPDTDTIGLDARGRQLYGLEPAAAVTRSSLRELVHPDDRPRFNALWRSTLQVGDQLRARFRVVRSTGTVRHVEVIGDLLQEGPTGARTQLLGVLRDVSDEVDAARLQIEKDAAERSAHARSEFLSRLSHELRTPLNAVLGLAQVLAIDAATPLTAQQHQRVQLILDSGWHLLRLVDDVLDVSSIDAGQVAVKLLPTELGPVMRASRQLVEAERERYDVRFDDRWPGETATVQADAQRLQQVLTNLLSNACKYNRRGGTVTLGYYEEDAAVALTVTDDGVGIGSQQIADLFLPFKRLPQTAEIPGVGLGLVVVKLLVEQMKGRVGVSSELGRGSTFTVWLQKA